MPLRIDATQRGRIEPRSDKKGHRIRYVRDRLAFLLFVLPAVAWYLIVMGWPLLNMFYMSSLRWDGVLLPSTFVGLRNYLSLLSDPHFVAAVKNTTIYVLVSLPLILIPGFVLGYFLSQHPPGFRILRVVYFAPSMISIVVAAMLFQGIYMDDGLLDSVLTSAGLGAFIHVWLADPQTALGSVMALDIWAGIGFSAVLFAAALSNVPPEVYEAARIDGAHPWTILWKIAFPITVDFFGVVAMLQFLGVLLWSAQNVALLTLGGPGDSSMTLSYYMLSQGTTPSNHLGYSQAIAVVLFVVGLAGMVLIRGATRRFARRWAE